jgi:hypothetical protein
VATLCRDRRWFPLTSPRAADLSAQAESSLLEKVGGGYDQEVGVVVEPADSGVAVPTEEATNLACGVVMIDMKVFRSFSVAWVWRLAYRTFPALVRKQHLVVGDGQSVEREKIARPFGVPSIGPLVVCAAFLSVAFSILLPASLLVETVAGNAADWIPLAVFSKMCSKLQQWFSLLAFRALVCGDSFHITAHNGRWRLQSQHIL